MYFTQKTFLYILQSHRNRHITSATIACCNGESLDFCVICVKSDFKVSFQFSFLLLPDLIFAHSHAFLCKGLLFLRLLPNPRYLKITLKVLCKIAHTFMNGQKFIKNDKIGQFCQFRNSEIQMRHFQAIFKQYANPFFHDIKQNRVETLQRAVVAQRLERAISLSEFLCCKIFFLCKVLQAKNENLLHFCFF